MRALPQGCESVSGPVVDAEQSEVGGSVVAGASAVLDCWGMGGVGGWLWRRLEIAGWSRGGLAPGQHLLLRSMAGSQSTLGHDLTFCLA